MLGVLLEQSSTSWQSPVCSSWASLHISQIILSLTLLLILIVSMAESNVAAAVSDPECFGIFKFPVKGLSAPPLKLTFHDSSEHAQNVDRFFARM